MNKMKRLIKTTTLNKILKLAENLLNDDQLNQINRAINQLTVNNRPKPLVNVYNEILNKAECTYSNTVYRKITFDLNDIVALNNSYKISKDEVFNYIKNNLETNSYQSCTKSLEACRNFEADWFDFEVIISFECSEGIDVMAICNKYLEIARQRYKDVQSGNSESKYGLNKLRAIIQSYESIIGDFESEEEVLAMVPNDYQIVEIVGIDMNNDILDLSVLAK